jgi:O-antigen/teichoic acid export membrane protein
MEQYKTITKQVGGVFFLKILDFGLMFILFMILTRFLTVSDFGLYSVLNVTALFATALLGLGFSNFILKDLPGDDEHVKRSKFSKIFSFNIVFLSISITLISLVSFVILSYTKYNVFFKPFFYVLVTAGLMLLGSLIDSYLKSKKKIFTATITEFMFRSLWALPVVLLLIFSRLSVHDIFLTRLAFTLIILIIVILTLRRYSLKFLNKPDKKYIKKAIIFGLPLTLTISDWIITAGDRYILGYFHTATQVGNYSYIYSLLNFILIFFATTLNLTIYPYIVEAYNKKLKQKVNMLFNSLIKYSLIITLPVLTGFFVLSEELITMISGTKYISAISIIPFLILFPLIEVGNRTYNKILYLKSQTKSLALIYVIGMVLNIILNLILIPRFSYYGAGIATTLAYIVMFILFYYKTHKNIKLDQAYLKIPNILLSTLIMGLALSFISPNNVFTKILTIILGAAIYFGSLYLTRAYVKEELDLIKSFLPGKKPLYNEPNLKD